VAGVVLAGHTYGISGHFGISGFATNVVKRGGVQSNLTLYMQLGPGRGPT